MVVSTRLAAAAEPDASSAGPVDGGASEARPAAGDPAAAGTSAEPRKPSKDDQGEKGEKGGAEKSPPNADAPDGGKARHAKLADAPTSTDAEPPLDARPIKRPLPDYDGRGPAPTTAGDVLIWVPRLVVSPLYLATEYLVHKPLAGLIIGIENNRVVQKALYVFTFAGASKIGFVPTFLIDFGFLPSVGVYFYWDDALVAHNHVRVHFGTWGPDWIKVGVTDRYDVGENSTAAMRFSYSKRSDNLFFGLGPDSSEDLKSRYGATIVDVGPAYDMVLGRGLALHTTVGFRDASFNDGTCCRNLPVQQRVRAGQLPQPPRLADGYTIGYQSAEFAFDTRAKRPAPQSGFRLAVDGQPAFDVSRRVGNSWLRYGGTAGAFWDVTGKARVLSLSASARFVDPMEGNGSDIPFNELVTLGGDGLMRGFLPGRLIDRSAAVGTLAYQWPIWVFLDGTLQASVGNVFGAGLKDFETKKLRLSTGFGLRTNNSPDHQFEILAGFGTNTFENGAGITSFRLALGATRGF